MGLLKHTTPLRQRSAVPACAFAALCLCRIGSSELGMEWSRMTQTTAWTGRDYHAAVVYDGRIWVMGGRMYDGDYETFDGRNDILCSSDGTSWARVLEHAAWSPRYGHASTVFDGAMWIIGGYDGSLLSDVWYSYDGTSWTQTTAAAQ